MGFLMVDKDINVLLSFSEEGRLSINLEVATKVMSWLHKGTKRGGLSGWFWDGKRGRMAGGSELEKARKKKNIKDGVGDGFLFDPAREWHSAGEVIVRMKILGFSVVSLDCDQDGVWACSFQTPPQRISMETPKEAIADSGPLSISAAAVLALFEDSKGNKNV